MANQLPSFLSGSNVVIKIGDMTVAFCQDLRFNRTMTNVPVRGIGSHSVHTLEPVDFSVSGQMSIVRYANLSQTFDAAKYQAQLLNKGILTADEITTLTANAVSSFNNGDRIGAISNFVSKPTASGNSLLDSSYFDPRKMLLTATFDIDVYDRKAVASGTKFDLGSAGNLIYSIKNCRLNSYSINFVPGQLLIENVTFLGTTCETITTPTSQVV